MHCVFRAVDLLTFLSFSFLIGRKWYGPNLQLSKPARVASTRPLFPVFPQKQVVLSCCVGAHVLDYRGEPVSSHFLWLVIPEPPLDY